ncbi:hypothetical protein [Arenibaculum pallidiluteum]|uniref:hypothetical protein n=1 Tax=Arenibaculum pallidiluteum TaxID=2812559 RepID=UPI001A95DC71|nr:hypothetical protein [Arenibaculum pallidiluteum]
MGGLGFYGVLAAVLIGAFRVSHQMRTAGAMQKQREGRLRKLSDHARQLARETLKLTRLKATEQERRSAVAAEIEAQKRILRELRLKAAPLVVFDERKVMGDRLWRVAIERVPPGGGPVPWRSFLVWASSSDRALAKLRARYAQPERFLFGEPEERLQMPPSA